MSLEPRAGADTCRTPCSDADVAHEELATRCGRSQRVLQCFVHGHPRSALEVWALRPATCRPLEKGDAILK